MFEILIGVAGGILSGLMAAALGYAKNVGSEFDDKAFIKTVVIGMFVGAVAAYMGLSYENAMAYVTTTGGLVLFEYVEKAIWRRIGERVKAFLRNVGIMSTPQEVVVQ